MTQEQEPDGTWKEPVRMSETIPEVLGAAAEAQKRAEEDQALAEADEIRAAEARAGEIEGRQICPGCGYIEPVRDELASRCPSCGTAYPMP